MHYANLIFRKNWKVLTLTTLLILSLGIFIPATQSPSANAEITSNTVLLTVTASPPILPSDGGTYSAVVLSFEYASTGLPFIPQSDIVVYMTSSNLEVGNVPNSVTFPAGSEYYQVNFATTNTPGITTISAAASGYLLATCNLQTTNTTGEPASSLAMYIAPATVLANGQRYNNIVIQMQNFTGGPQKSSSPVTVQLVSQNSTVGSVTPSITIQPGSTYASATFTSTNLTGTVSISAVASGFLSAEKTVKTAVLPLTVRVTASPSLIPIGGHSEISILVSSNNIPVSGAAVSWSAAFGSISNAEGQTNQSGSATATYRAGQLPGTFSVTVSVSQPGYSPASTGSLITVSAQAPAQKSGGFFSMNLLFIPIWILIIVAGSAGGVFGFFFIRKRRAGDEEEGEFEQEEV